MTTGVESCEHDTMGLCDWVYEQTENDTAAQAASWLLGKPVAIIVVLIIALITRTISRWMIHRGVRRIMMPPVVVAKGLDALNSADPVDATTGEIERARKSARAESIGAALAGLAGAMIWTVALIVSLSILGVDLGPLLAGAGVIGVAVGFGSQSLVRDCMTGMFMLIEDQYGIGDTVDLGSAAGTVEKVSLRTTVLRGVDGTVWHVPNGEVKRVGNQSQLWSMALVDIEIPRKAGLDRARTVIEEGAREVTDDPAWTSSVLEPPRILGVESVKGDVVTVRLQVKTTPGRQWAIQRALRESIKRHLDDSGISTPE